MFLLQANHSVTTETATEAQSYGAAVRTAPKTHGLVASTATLALTFIEARAQADEGGASKEALRKWLDAHRAQIPQEKESCRTIRCLSLLFSLLLPLPIAFCVIVAAFVVAFATIASHHCIGILALYHVVFP